MHQKAHLCCRMCGEVKFLFYETSLGGGQLAQRMRVSYQHNTGSYKNMLLYCVKMHSHLIWLALYLVPF